MSTPNDQMPNDSSSSTTAQAGTISGQVFNQQGNALPHTLILIRQGDFDGGNVLYQTHTGDDGFYSLKVPDAPYRVDALVQLLYRNARWQLYAHPDDDSNDLQDSTNGIIKNFTWHLIGLQPDGDPKNPFDSYGGHVLLYFPDPTASGAGYSYQLTLTPQGLLADGTGGEEKTYTIKQGLGTDDTINPLVDIPLGVYSVTGTAADPSGQPLSLTISTVIGSQSTTLTFEPDTVGIRPAKLFLSFESSS